MKESATGYLELRCSMKSYNYSRSFCSNRPVTWFLL